MFLQCGGRSHLNTRVRRLTRYLIAQNAQLTMTCPGKFAPKSQSDWEKKKKKKSCLLPGSNAGPEVSQEVDDCVVVGIWMESGLQTTTTTKQIREKKKEDLVIGDPASYGLTR